MQREPAVRSSGSSQKHRSNPGNKPFTSAAAPAATPSPPFQIILCGNPNDVDCRFWLGLMQHGDLSPQQLLDLPDVRGLFQRAATSGIREAPPLMLSDTSRVPPRYFFIMNSPLNTEPDHADWVKQVVEALQSWSPPRAGFILSPKLLELPSSRQLLVRVIEQIAAVSKIRQFYFSVESHGFNAGLNAMLSLRLELEAKGIRVHVFH